MAKLTGEALKFFQEAGRKGARALAKKYGPKQRKLWGSLGGRPREENTLLIIKALKAGPKSRREIRKVTKLDLATISATLERLSAKGEVVHFTKGDSKRNTRKWKLHDASIKSKAENKNGQQEPGGQNGTAALAS